jgi:hypothetical protein
MHDGGLRDVTEIGSVVPMNAPKGAVNEARAIDMTGRIFNRLTVIGPSRVVPREGRGRPSVRMPCRCSCGVVLDVDLGCLTKHKARSCGGCGEVPRHPEVHGHAKRNRQSSTYRIWHGMMQRCYSPGASGYDSYGGRGIAVCDQWRDNFPAFLADMGERPAGKSIDRIDNTKGYEPSNCRWATPSQQSRNTSSNRMVTYGGETLPLVVWVERLGVGQQTLTSRLNRGWSAERALTTPAGKYVRRIT